MVGHYNHEYTPNSMQINQITNFVKFSIFPNPLKATHERESCVATVFCSHVDWIGNASPWFKGPRISRHLHPDPIPQSLVLGSISLWIPNLRCCELGGYFFTPPMILLMAEILHQLIGSLSHCFWGFIHPRWCRISAINGRRSLLVNLVLETHVFDIFCVY